MAKDYWFQFVPKDWAGDQDLLRCSLAAEGLWIRLLCMMFECDQRGVLASAGRAWGDEDVARAVRGSSDVTLAALRELLDAGVVRRRRSDGALYSARMVRDEEARQYKSAVRSESGRLGGRPKKQNESKTKANTKAKRKQTLCNCNCSCNSYFDCPELEKLYQAFPRHVGRKAAFTAMNAAILRIRSEVDDPVAFLLERIHAYAESVREYEQRHICHPATWFNGERWTDEGVVREPNAWLEEDATP